MLSVSNQDDMFAIRLAAYFITNNFIEVIFEYWDNSGLTISRVDE